MKHGDFTELAEFYVHRPGYSGLLLNMLYAYVKSTRPPNQDFIVADVGAGTGKLTENLAALGLAGYAVEPNEAMRKNGINALKDAPFTWLKGTAEATGLPDNCCNWVLMGSSFHWADTEQALRDFHRILRPGGYFTAIYNPRNIEKSAFHQNIEEKIAQMVPGLRRVSSGSSKNMKDMDEKLLSTKYFGDLIFSEAAHTEIMSKERYLGAWKSVNDIQVQAGPEGFRKILDFIQAEISPYAEIEVPYKSRSWTVRTIF